MRDFRELKVWHKAHRLTLAIYVATQSFPREEIYGLTSQIRRAAVSIGANVAEGAGKSSGAEFGRFLQIALGSASEVEYHILLARDLGYLDDERYEQLSEDVVEVKKMACAFAQFLGKKTGQRSAVSLQPSGKPFILALGEIMRDFRELSDWRKTSGTALRADC